MLKNGAVDPAAGGGLAPLRGRRLVLLALVGTLAQVTQGVIGLALVLVGNSAGFAVSTSAAGVGAFMLGAAIGRPIQGRALDHSSARTVLWVCGFAHFGSYLAIATAADHGVPTAFLAACTAAGLTLPPIATRQRALWPSRVQRDRAIGVFALISSLQTVSLLVAPALFTAVLVLSSPTAAMLSVAGLAALCTLACGLLDDERATVVHGGRVAIRSYLAPLVATALLGVVAGSLEVVAPVLAIAAHHSTAAGLLVLAESAGTFVGALVATKIPHKLANNLLGAGMALQALGCALLMVPSSLVVAGVELFVVGVGITPALSTLSMFVSRFAGGTAESFGWQSTALTAGTAAGSACAGILAHGLGSHASSSVALGSAVVGLALAPRLTRHSDDTQ